VLQGKVFKKKQGGGLGRGGPVLQRRSRLHQGGSLVGEADNCNRGGKPFLFRDSFPLTGGKGFTEKATMPHEGRERVFSQEKFLLSSGEDDQFSGGKCPQRE